MDDNIKKELQSAAFDRLVKHLRERKDVQKCNIEGAIELSKSVILNSKIQKNLDTQEREHSSPIQHRPSHTPTHPSSHLEKHV